MMYRNIHKARLKKIERDKAEGIIWKTVSEEYINGLSIGKIAQKYKTTFNRIRRGLQENNIHIRTFSEAQQNSVKKGTHIAPQKGKRMQQHSSWKGGLNIYDCGGGNRRYINVNGKYISYAKYLFLKENNLEELPKGFCIHHKDENSLNDNIKNLEMITRSKHAFLHNEIRRCLKLST